MEKVKIRTELLKQLAENNSFSEELIKKEFPKLFENKLEVGKWYKSNYKDNNNIIYKVSEIEYYGFISDNWVSYKSTTICWDYLNLATPQEVETALINEAKKKGYKIGNYKCLSGYVTLENIKNNYFLDNNYYLWFGTKGNANCVFKNGKWAEIIETPKDIITIVEKYGKDKVISLIEKM